MTTAAPKPRGSSPSDPAPDAVRCPTPGCWRRRNPAPRGRGLTATCWHCRNVAKVARPAAPRGPAPKPYPESPGRPAALIVALEGVGLWTRAAAADPDSWADPPVTDLPAGTRCAEVCAPGLDGGAVLELPCGGRFACPAGVYRLLTAAEAGAA